MEGPARSGLATVAAFTLALLAASLWRRWASGVAWTLALVAAQYAAALALRGGDRPVDAAAPLVAGALLVLAELAYWSLDLAGPGHEERRVLVRRLTAVLALAFLSVLLGGLVVVVTGVPLGGGLAWNAIGVAAAAGTLAILARLARRVARSA